MLRACRCPRRTASRTFLAGLSQRILRSGKTKEAGLDTPGAERLTEEEKRVLKLLVVGRNSKEIAAELAISPEIVREHVQSILAKLQVHSRLEAAARTISSEVIERESRRRTRGALGAPPCSKKHSESKNSKSVLATSQ